ncbi:hypothetical protein SAMN04488136_10660 [Vibrio xiamenensis]|uniref:Uncharacterized protein n=1 Tax=Vibrio xiamenensis TaxID=861298 RepID=A0A1G7YWD0_9VIBR|nr:hypothetical protein [Vibrio xiamenensis]SDH00140.1 hypothetical protein SAMN04488136_10660 [Vibrio xiamenensis]
MAQVMNFDSIATTDSMDRKTYSVSFKGLIAHLLDILFTDNSTRSYYSSELSGHMQKDIGIYR